MPEPPRRKRFQFSLRSLMLAVLIYGLLWVITVKWGARRLAEDHAAQLGAVKFNAEKTAFEYKEESYFWAFPRSIRGRVSVPAPFVLTYSSVVSFDAEGPFQSCSPRGLYIWVFGFRGVIRESEWVTITRGISPPY